METNLSQLAQQTADVAVTKIRTEGVGYSVNAFEIASVILAALRSVAEQKDAELAALRSALEAVRENGCLCVHGAHWDETHQSGAGCPICIRQRPVAELVRTVLSTDAGTALLREVETWKAHAAESDREFLQMQDWLIGNAEIDPKLGLIDRAAKCKERIRDLVAAEGERDDLCARLAKAEAAQSHMESCRALIGARDDETLHDAISDLRERVKKASELMAQMLNLASHQIASERLGGNVVKEEYWKGEHAAVTAILAALEGQ